MATLLWILGAWVVLSVALGLLIGRAIRTVNPPCEVADATDWDELRVVLLRSYARRVAANAGGGVVGAALAGDERGERDLPQIATARRVA